MKIAYVLNTYPQPSHSFIRREVQALERQGFDITRLAMRRSEAALVDARDQGEAAQTTYVLDRGAFGLFGDTLRQAIRAPIKTAKGFFLAWRMGRASQIGVLRHFIYLAEAAHVARRCRADEIEHVHAHFGTNAAAVAMLSHVLGGPRYSFTVHGPEEFDAPHTLSLGDKLDHASFAVGVSAFGRSQLCRWASFAAWDRLHVVHCGIEPAAFEHSTPVPDGPLRLVAIGRFVEQKGQMVLIRALEHLKEAHPDTQLALVGDGEMRNDLEHAVTDAGLGDMVRFTGWLDQDGVRAEIEQAHALVMPSFAEGLPMVIMEAMAAARPVIATYIAGTPELVVEGQTGWLVPAGDDFAFAKAMEMLAAAPTEGLARMGETGRARVLQRHDIDDQARKLGDLFRAAADC
ncbi:glycosyltransferase family 4 protein [Falsiruegeria litorea]|uniref:glycosyltransferase family 4 protein n=1 Tax=Falsiruegeria litorea TaxID=1280831 RepID=UPI000A271283|nr:glycosyltransferase family 4 protein [Falsiruegeria litorea]